MFLREIKMFEFREIRPEDNAALAKIIRDNLKANGLDIPGTAYFDSNLDTLSSYYLNNPNRFYCVLTADGQVVGGVGVDSFDPTEACGELQKLYLTDKCKGQGLGRKLVEFIQEKAQELGYKKLYLETHSNLDVAIQLYKKMGFIEIDKPANVIHSTMDRFFLKEL